MFHITIKLYFVKPKVNNIIKDYAYKNIITRIDWDLLRQPSLRCCLIVLNINNKLFKLLDQIRLLSPFSFFHMWLCFQWKKAFITGNWKISNSPDMYLLFLSIFMDSILDCLAYIWLYVLREPKVYGLKTIFDHRVVSIIDITAFALPVSIVLLSHFVAIMLVQWFWPLHEKQLSWGDQGNSLLPAIVKGLGMGT